MSSAALAATSRSLSSDNAVLADLAAQGWADCGVRLSPSEIAALREGLGEAYRICREAQVKNGIAANTDGTVHHILNLHPALFALLESLPMHAAMTRFFEGSYILNSYGGVINRKGALAYVGNVHRDVRFHTFGQPLMLNLIVALHDFTLENGATHFLTGSHRVPEKPTDEDFFARADRFVVPAGTFGLFDSNLWHCTGVNTTDQERNALTLTFTKPFFKPQLDYPRLLGYDDGEKYGPELRQILGYNSRIPSTLDEWYQPPEKRFYKPGQG